MERLKIEYLPIDKLTPYENNTRRHGKESIQVIKDSIESWGMCDPIGIWGEKNTIVEGHGRYLALQKLGRTEAPCIRLDHLTDEERKAYAIAHNKTFEFSEWDFEMLQTELGSIDIDMSDFGLDFNLDDSVGTHGEEDTVEALEEKESGGKEKSKLVCPCCGFEFEV